MEMQQMRKNSESCKRKRNYYQMPVLKYKCNKRLIKSSMKWGRRLLCAGILLLMLQLVKVLGASNGDPNFESEEHYHSRTLKSSNTSDGGGSHGPTWESCDFEKAHSPYAFLPLYIFIIFVLFVALAIICDDFFVPSLEGISEKLDLSEDVAGATFMAAGSSAPELFTSVAGVGVQSDVGIGTIVGFTVLKDTATFPSDRSAMFNILIIVALSAVLSGQVLNLDWRPLFRDATVYALSIALLIGFAWDGYFEWYEALTLLLVYIMYIVMMKFNKHLMKFLLKFECKWCRNDSRVEPAQEHSSEPSQSSSETSATKGQGDTTEASHTHEAHHHHDRPSISHSLHDEHKHRFVHSHRGELAGSFANRRRSVNHHLSPHTSSSATGIHHAYGRGSLIPHIAISQHPSTGSQTQDEAPTSENAQDSTTASATAASQASHVEEEEAIMVLIPCLPPIRTIPPDIELAREEGTKWGWVKFVLRWMLFILSFPFVVLFTWTIPNCSENRKWYVVTSSFLMSIFWIAVISFIMVTIVARAGCILSVAEFTMGLVVVAVGTSIPDALSSILVARDGFGDMAVSNAIGSNVFDVNLGLGLPFLIRILIDKGKAFSLLGDEQREVFENGEYVIVPHAKFGFLLLFVLFLSIATFAAFRFRLNAIMGLCFVCIYALFLTYAFIQETVCEEGKLC